MTLMYQSSKGPKPIDSLPFPYLSNAIAKLEREGYGPERADEVAAMRARLAELETKEDGPEGGVADALPADHQIGANHPPEPALAVQPAPEAVVDPFGALQVHAGDLYLESKNWADGQEITNAAQAAEVDRLIDDWKDFIRLVEAKRDADIVPLQAQITTVRERYYPLIGETKKVTGIAVRAKVALLAVKTKWGDKLRAAQKAEADRLRQIALDQAADAVRQTQTMPDNLAVAESAEDLIRAAQGNLKRASQIEKAAPKGFRVEWVTTIADNLTAIRAMWRRYPDDFTNLALTLAKRDVREGKRQIDGFTITETKVAV